MIEKMFDIDPLTLVAMGVINPRSTTSTRYPFTEAEVKFKYDLDKSLIPKIEKVIFNKPATVVLWEDGVKTVVKCDKEDTYDKEKGLLIAILKRLSFNKGAFYKELIMPWINADEKGEPNEFK